MAQDPHRKFVLAFTVFFFLFPCLLIAFNYQVDPNRRYRFSVSEPDLKRLAASEELVLTLPPNYDDRALLKKFVPNSIPPEIVILGGSRIANVQAYFFKKPWRLQLLNASVTEGTIRDYVSLWQMIEQQKYTPKFVFICIEEQSMNSYSQNSKYLSIYEYYTSFFNQKFSLRQQFLGLTTNLKDLLSFQTTLASIRILRNPLLVEAAGKIVLFEDYNKRVAVKTHSFSTIPPFTTENQDPKLVFFSGQRNGMGEEKVFEKWNSHDYIGYEHLEKLIQRVKRNGGIPIVVGMPYHPAAYAVIQGNSRAYENMLLFVRELKKIADREGVFFYDAIETHHGDFQNVNFYDGVHLRTQYNYLFFRAICHDANLQISADSFESSRRESRSAW